MDQVTSRAPSLSAPVQAVVHTGARQIKLMNKLGIQTLQDLLAWFPRRYEDRRQTRHIADLEPDETACVEAVIADTPRAAVTSRGLTLVKVTAVDGPGTLDITFFNQPWLCRTLVKGSSFVFFGRAEGSGLRRAMTSPVAEPAGQGELTGRIVPFYPLTAGLSQQVVQRCVRQGLDACGKILPETLPEDLRKAHNLCRIEYAYENIHFPADEKALEVSRRRLAFEELFLFTLVLQNLRRERGGVRVPPCREIDMEPFYSALPFQLTDAQRRCVDEALADMRSGLPMNRLCQGDVGSGKTMVAAACVYFCVRNGRQAALMVPTEVLSQQHFSGLSPLLEGLGIRCALLTGSTPAKEKRELSARLAAGELDFLVGTHALITGGLHYRDLGLVVTDEQHRFGVAQRAALAEKGAHPHTLVMSATPIPRTLALILYGDLDVSVIDQLPPGRRPVETYAVPSSYHPRLYNFIRKQVAQGRQVYVICSMVAENEDLPDERKAVTEYTRMLQTQALPDLRIACVHGKMKPREKEAVMAAFSAGESDVLVSTTVIEVGVDVPNASLIIVENAERFGLSQLHQLRGRVGRGKHQSYCVLVSDNKSEETRARLRIMTKTSDGFKIAEEDLRLRGAGDLLGQRQHGMLNLRIADIGCDMELLKEAQQAAEDLLRRDPALSTCPETAARMQEVFRQRAEAMN